MKAITVIQPWATLIALGEKRFETRSWATKHRGEIAIHAGKKIDKAVCRLEPLRSVLDLHGYDVTNLPIGVILATARLSGCYRVVHHEGEAAKLETGRSVEGLEYLFGNYSEGRYAWEIQDVNVLAEPIPAKGQLGLWEYPFNLL